MSDKSAHPVEVSIAITVSGIPPNDPQVREVTASPWVFSREVTDWNRFRGQVQGLVGSDIPHLVGDVLDRFMALTPEEAKQPPEKKAKRTTKG